MLRSPSCVIAEGDLIIIHHGYQNLRPLRIDSKETLQCKDGIFEHKNFIGAKYGTYVAGRHPSKATTAPPPKLLVLKPTPELWTLAVPRRTQIIYATDISVIIQNLRLRPGSRIAEAGTGSGSLTHSLGSTVAPNGKVFTFDFHKARFLEAKEEFVKNGFEGIIVSGWRDVCSVPEPGKEIMNEDVDVKSLSEPLPGYGLPHGTIDAVFLDVPSPWLAVPNVVNVLKPNGMICSFSPCVEQTQKLCAALRDEPNGVFVDIHTVETLGREHVPIQHISGIELGTKRPRTDTPEPEDANGSASGTVEVATLLAQQTPYFRPAANNKGHSAFLTFARVRSFEPQEAAQAPKATSTQ